MSMSMLSLKCMAPGVAGPSELTSESDESSVSLELESSLSSSLTPPSLQHPEAWCMALDAIVAVLFSTKRRGTMFPRTWLFGTTGASIFSYIPCRDRIDVFRRCSQSPAVLLFSTALLCLVTTTGLLIRRRFSAGRRGASGWLACLLMLSTELLRNGKLSVSFVSFHRNVCSRAWCWWPQSFSHPGWRIMGAGEDGENSMTRWSVCVASWRRTRIKCLCLVSFSLSLFVCVCVFSQGCICICMSRRNTGNAGNAGNADNVVV